MEPRPGDRHDLFRAHGVPGMLGERTLEHSLATGVVIYRPEVEGRYTAVRSRRKGLPR